MADMGKKRIVALIALFSLVVTSVVFVTPAKAEGTYDEFNVYRMYNPYTSEHLYTINHSEKDHLYSIGWNYEGIAWIAQSKGIPVYRFYNKYTGEHHYTQDAGEKEYLEAVGWDYENIAWYSSDVETECTAPVYRLFNPNMDAAHEAGAHHYTMSEAEKDALVAENWIYEGISWESTHKVEYYEGLYVNAYEFRGTQVYCNKCQEMIYDGWDRGTDFDSLEELMARHLNEKHGASIDIDYVDPARWTPFEEKQTYEEYQAYLPEYVEYITPRLYECMKLQANFKVDYEGSQYGFRPKQYIVAPGYAVCNVCDHMFYEK